MKRAEFKPYTIIEEINDACDSLISLVNVRRQQLMELLKEREKKMEDLKTCKERAQMEYPLEDKLYKTSSCEPWYRCPTNFAQKLHSHTYTKEREAYGQFKITVKCNKEAFRQSLSTLIDVVLDVTNPDDMSYEEKYPHGGIITNGCYGIDAGEYGVPYGIDVDEDSNKLFVADFGHKKVMICSCETGAYLQEIRAGDNVKPWGIAVTPYGIFITSFDSHELLKYSRPDHHLVKRVGRIGSRNGEFNRPMGIAINKETELLYVCDMDNHRITVHDTEELQHIYSITHRVMLAPADIQLVGDSMYVLCSGERVIILRNEDYISTIVSSNLDRAYFFRIDSYNNLVISDSDTHNIKIFSPTGRLINTICKAGHAVGELYYPMGIFITSNNRIICISSNRNNIITILC